LRPGAADLIAALQQVLAQLDVVGRVLWLDPHQPLEGLAGQLALVPAYVQAMETALNLGVARETPGGISGQLQGLRTPAAFHQQLRQLGQIAGLARRDPQQRPVLAHRFVETALAREQLNDPHPQLTVSRLRLQHASEFAQRALVVSKLVVHARQQPLRVQTRVTCLEVLQQGAQRARAPVRIDQQLIELVANPRTRSAALTRALQGLDRRCRLLTGQLGTGKLYPDRHLHTRIATQSLERTAVLLDGGLVPATSRQLASELRDQIWTVASGTGELPVPMPCALELIAIQGAV